MTPTRMAKWLLMTALFSTMACAQAEKPQVTTPLAAPEVAPPIEAPAPEIKPAQVVKPPTETKPAPRDGEWRLVKGHLTGQRPAPKLVSQTKNAKTPGFTTDTCWNYGAFAVFETRSDGEVGSAEIVIRHASLEHKNLCAQDYPGKTSALRIIEGHFAGVAGGYVAVAGEDLSEGLPEFQIFDVESGKEVIKFRHHPNEGLTIRRKGGVTSVDFFGALAVKCELAADGEECWKKVLKLNSVRRATPMPDCKAAFAKSGTDVYDTAQVTAPARIGNLKSPKIEIIGGRATCAPAP